MQWQTIQVPLAAGLNQKADERALQAPELLIAKDVEFDELGGLQTRHPYAAIGADIFGGGTLSNARRLVANGDELLCFTKDTLYSWNATLSKWVSKGTHLAARLDEAPVFVTTGDQQDCDRAELSGTVFYSWHEEVGGTSYGYVAAVDAETGAVLMAPYQLAGFQRVRLVALATKVILAFYDGVGGIYCYALDPTSPATALAGASTTLSSGAVGTSAGPYFDIVKQPGADTAVFVVGASAAAAYTIGTVTAGLTVARSSKARNNAGAIAVSCEPTGASAQVVRGNGGNIEGDLITISTLADVYTAQAIGTYTVTLNQIAAAHRSTQDSAVYRCYCFWSVSESATLPGWRTKYNWVSTGNTLGTEDTFVYDIAPVSRAFDHEGRIYLWMVFAGESSFTGSGAASWRTSVQNSFFLYRDDAFLVAKSTMGKAGGFAPSTGRLPGVQDLGASVFAWCGTERRVIEVGEKQTGYGARAPRDIRVTFDSNEARRCVRLGKTLYVTGGEILQYDGRQLTEVGFHVFPWVFGVAEVASGNLADGTYTYKVTARWDNAQGDRDRSTTATTAQVTIAAGPNGASITTWNALTVTHKAESPIAIEVWRTPANATDDSPFYLVTSNDPGDTANPNRYIENEPAAGALDTFNDEYADSTATTKESNPENVGVLENLAPPAATIIAASADRLFLAGVAGEPSTIWYSKLRADGEVASFHDALRVSLPSSAGAITGLAFLNETLIAFTATAIYALPGDGYDNTGGGANYGPARLLSSDVGATVQESIALTDRGLIFMSRKGWYILNRGWAVEYVGGPVCDYDSDTIAAVHTVEGQHQVRCLTTSRMLVLDTLVGQWAEWTISDGVHAAVWDGTYHYLTATGPKAEQSDYTGVDYGLDVETAWIKLADLQGFGRIRKVLVLGEYRSAHTLRIRIARDYLTTYFDDGLWTVSPTTVGGPEQLKHGPSYQRCQAIKVRITACGSDATTSSYTTPTGEALKLTGLGLELGFKRGLFRPLPAAQRQ